MGEITRLFLNSDLTPETVVLTSVWEGIDKFAEVLYKDYGQFFIFLRRFFRILTTFLI